VLQPGVHEGYQKKAGVSRDRVHYIDFKKGSLPIPSAGENRGDLVSDPVDRRLESKIKGEALKSGMAIQRLTDPWLSHPGGLALQLF